MKRALTLMVALFLLSEVRCSGLLPTTATDNPEAFCGTIGAFYCNTYIQPQDLPNGWPGFCMTPAYSFGGITGYVGVTGNGGATPAYPSTSEAWDACGADRYHPQGVCVSVVRCTRSR